MKNKNFQNAFSLMEMMVVLLIVAIIAAATAPMVTKKMARNVGSGDSPWVFTGLNNNIAYNMSGANASAIIGATNYSYSGNQPKYPRLVLAANGADHPALVFAGANGAYGGQINMDPDNRIVTMNDQTVGNASVAFGFGQSIANTPTGVVAVGQGVTTSSTDAVAVGRSATANGEASVAIGSNANATAVNTTALGPFVRATSAAAIAIGRARAGGVSSIAIGDYLGTTQTSTGTSANRSIAIGAGAQATNEASIAIGAGAQSTFSRSVAIGAGAETTAPNQIVLGTSEDVVYIPGNLIVAKNTLLGSRGRGYRTFISHKTYGRNNWHIKSIEVNKGSNDDLRWGEDYSESAFKTSYSDRRLKNVGDKYTAGLEELKKLDFYHYTFKADKDNTPLVGVMAQDLQKVFPDAVTKGEDGYLRIRLEDMFYAVINAVKELDTKISEIVTNITDIRTTIQSQQEIIEGLQKENSELQKQNADLQEEIKNIEKRIKKLEK